MACRLSVKELKERIENKTIYNKQTHTQKTHTHTTTTQIEITDSLLVVKRVTNETNNYYFLVRRLN